MREKRRICFHLFPLLKKIPRKRSKEQERILHHGVRLSLKLISCVHPALLPVPLFRDLATGLWRAQHILWFGWNICHKENKTQALVNRGQGWWSQEADHWQVENIPKGGKGPLSGFVKSSKDWHVFSQTSFLSVCFTLNIPLTCGLILPAIFSIRG